ncbi:MAG: hypothetical protein M1818_000682 [Claussenomyces sp. TS43310]|nr:MAG: hypothetical protein M1818_000682 [Claussenomyces sp. TS43310]
MSAHLPSSNPFRRRSPAQVDPSNSNRPTTQSVVTHPLSLDTTVANLPSPNRTIAKPVKKVRVQSPPPSSPENESIPRKPPTPIPRGDEPSEGQNGPFSVVDSDAFGSSTRESLTDRSVGVPMNPFHKTLATLEHTDRDILTDLPPTIQKGGSSAGRTSLDVDAFKRLLMTGDAGVKPALPGSSGSSFTHVGQVVAHDGGNSTDTSSASRQSMFEPLQEPLAESPRTSHEISDIEGEHRRLRSDSQGSNPDRKKPPPPSHKHGKLIRVELKDDTTSPIFEGPSDQGSGLYQPRSEAAESTQALRSPTDLNKPLPAAPTRASHDSDRESIFDREAAGKTPEPPSPTLSTRRKTPPAPPLSRRQSQLVSDSRLTRTNSNRLPTNIEDGANPATGKSNAQTNSKAPPPPPTRRPQSIRQMPQPASSSSSAGPLNNEPDRLSVKSGFVPPPPPTRMLSGRQSGRPPSVSSLDMSSKRQSVPPPPPRRRASSKTSIDTPMVSPGSSRPSGEFLRSTDSARRGSSASHTSFPEFDALDARPPQPANDILADITALQKEIDALRGHPEKKSPS